MQTKTQHVDHIMNVVYLYLTMTPCVTQTIAESEAYQRCPVYRKNLMDTEENRESVEAEGEIWW